jgi:hypothetical protein
LRIPGVKEKSHQSMSEQIVPRRSTRVPVPSEKKVANDFNTAVHAVTQLDERAPRKRQRKVATATETEPHPLKMAQSLCDSIQSMACYKDQPATLRAFVELLMLPSSCIAGDRDKMVVAGSIYRFLAYNEPLPQNLGDACGFP